MKRSLLPPGKYIFVLGLFLTISTIAQNDNWLIEKVDWEDGFFQNTVDCIIQDKQGFIFIGTSNGLYRYDGYNFKNYVPGYGLEGNLKHTLIFSMAEDQNGSIWIGTEGGLYRYNRENEKFIFYNDTEEIKKIWYLYFDSKNRLWLGTSMGWFVANAFEKEENINFRHVPSINTGNYSRALFIYETRDGILFANNPTGLVKIKANFESEPIPIFAQGKDPDNYQVYDFCETQNGDLLLGTSSGLFLLKNGDRGFGLYPVLLNTGEEIFLNGDISIWQVTEDIDGNLWLLNDRLELIKYSQVRGLVAYPLVQDERAVFFPEPSCNMFIDRSGVLWLGSTTQGLFKVRTGLKDFETIRRTDSYPDLLSNFSVNCFCKDSYDNLWIGTKNGINILTPKNQASRQFIQLINEPGKREYFQSNHITCMLEEKEGSIWIGTTGGLTHMIYQNEDFKNCKIVNYYSDTANAQMLQSPFIANLCYTSEKELWIGTRNGLSLFLPGKIQGEGSFLTFQHDLDDSNSICHNEIFSICEGNDHCLWIGTNGGGLSKLRFNKFNGKSQAAFTHYASDPTDIRSLTNNSIYSVYEDLSSNLWVGVWGGGLNKMITDSSGKFMHFKHYGIKEGLPDFGVYGILEDENGYLWISTDRGLSKFDPEDEVFTNYNIKDGLQDNNFRKFAYYKDKYGKMYFGGLSGYTSFFPLSIEDSRSSATPVITKMFLFGREIISGEEVRGKIILENPISQTHQLTLAYTENSFSFELSALHYIDPERCRFLYKLENYDSEWNEADGLRPVATYTRVTHGDYIFKLKASNSDGIWNETPWILNIHIRPPVWLSPFAYLFYILILALIVFLQLFTKHQRDRIKKDLFINQINSEKEKKLEQYKMEFYTNIAHELRTPVSLILGPIEELVKSKNTDGHVQYLYQIMKKNGQHLLALIDQLLYFRKAETGHMKMEVAKYDFVHLMRETVQVFESWSQKKNIRFRISFPPTGIHTYFDQEKIFKIFSNLISNALKYSPDNSQISIAANIIEKYSELHAQNLSYVEVEISDQGCGIAEDQLENIFKRFYRSKNIIENSGSGIGLALTKRLIEIHNGDIKVESELNKGTTVKFWIPAEKEHYKPEDLKEESDFNIAHQNLHLNEIGNIPLDEPGLVIGEKSSSILIVDDDKDLNNYLSSLFFNQYKILQAYDGEKALTITMEELPDLIISDIMLPGISGLEFCKEIKSNLATSHIPVILITAMAENEFEMIGLKSGANDYISKPFNPEIISTKVENQFKYLSCLKEKYSKTISLDPGSGEIRNSEDEFLAKAFQICEKHISDSGFSVKNFEREIGMSRSQLHKKLSLLTGQSPNKFIRSLRLKRASHLLEKSNQTVAEITFDVGFNDLKYFRKCFSEEFGMPPSEYKEKSRSHNN